MRGSGRGEGWGGGGTLLKRVKKDPVTWREKLKLAWLTRSLENTAKTRDCSGAALPRGEESEAAMRESIVRQRFTRAALAGSDAPSGCRLKKPRELQDSRRDHEKTYITTTKGKKRRKKLRREAWNLPVHYSRHGKQVLNRSCGGERQRNNGESVVILRGLREKVKQAVPWAALLPLPQPLKETVTGR